MMLLIFAAGLTAQFRFVSTVTILQQTNSRPAPDVVRRGGNRAEDQGE
jgi:hypothetical protein